jgi:di/tricarboxylate transporter
MPLSFAGQLGGTLTLIGTSTNLLVAGLVLDLGVERIELFDITPPALVVCAVGVLYLLTLGRWLMPSRETEVDLLESYELHDYLSALRVRPDSSMVGRSLSETRFGSSLGLNVVRMTRADGTAEAAHGATVIRAGDLLIVEGKIRNIAKIEKTQGLEREEAEPALAASAGPALRLAEVLVPQPVRPVRRTLRELELRSRFGVSAVAVRRHATPLHQPLADTRLQPGDMLLVQGTTEALHRLHTESGLVLLGPVDLPPLRTERMRLAVGIAALVVLLPALGVTSILVSALAGVVAMFATACITPDEAYSDIDWMVIVLLGAILPLGFAMHATGAAAWVAHGLLGIMQPLGPHGILAGFLVLTTALTSVLSNAAAAVVLTPIAVAVALPLGLSPLPFVVAVMIGASNSFLSPVGYQTNTMIYGPGGYTFADFLRVGTPLSLLVVIAATFAVPLFFPFR